MEKKYVLEMFPYPSGNIHMGHVRNYVIGDICARYHKLKGHSVVHPMGWDAFGLPAENAAIQNKTHPKEWTYKNISKMKSQLQQLNLDLDWESEFATCDPEYYKQQQQIFIDFYKQGLAYKKDSFVNWDPVDQTVLANEQVIDGKGWRTGAPVVQKKLSQWFFKITNYAEELLESINELEEWPEKVKTMQKNWIGKSVGAEIKFFITESNEEIEIFTTRPDTIYGASFIALSINHEVARKYLSPEDTLATESLFSEASEKEKLGVNLNITCNHPITNEKLPVFVANFVLDNYGQGAVFGCPAHDERDYEFATNYKLPIRKVIECKDEELPYTGNGVVINSDIINGLQREDAIERIITLLADKKIGKKSINFKLRDWGVSRQRYWGCPIPVIYYEDGSYRVLEKDELPVTLPENINFDGRGNPLAKSKPFVELICSKTGKKAFRETDTLDTFVDSSWYFMRFLDSKNENLPFSREKVNSLMPVDKYIGGIEHAILHLLYARFFTKALRDIYKLNFGEPFKQLFTQGMITHKTFKSHKGVWLTPREVVINEKGLIDIYDKEPVEEGPVEKMSKSKKNTVEPEDILNNYGIDATRVFVISDSPPDRNLEWTEDGIQGSKNLIHRIEKYFNESGEIDSEVDSDAQKKINLFIYNMDNSIKLFALNKCIAEIYSLLNYLEKNKIKLSHTNWGGLILVCLFPIMPDLANKIHKNIFDTEVNKSSWPSVSKKDIKLDEIILPIQINGKLVAKIKIKNDYSLEEAMKSLYQLEKINARIQKKDVKKTIHVQNKIINIII